MTTYAQKMNRRGSYRRSESNSFMVWNKTAFICALVVICAVVFMGGLLTGKVLTILSGDYISVNAHTKEVNSLKAEIATLKTEIGMRDAAIANQEKELASLQTIIDETDKNVDYIVKKYSYVWDNLSDKATMCYSHLLKLDEVAKRENVNPHIMLAMFNVESTWNDQAKPANSTSRGYSQMLASTGKYVWRNLLNKPAPYNHAVTEDPYTNIEMGVTYFAYKVNGEGNLKGSILGYNGAYPDDRYYLWVKGKMATYGTANLISTPGYVN